MFTTPKGKSELFLASCLCDGLEDNNIEQITTLLECKNADPNVLIPMHGITPFHLIIGNESELFAIRVTKLFLRHGGNPNVKSYDGMTPVHVAAAWGRVKILELLLANGGDPLCLDDDRRTPLQYAYDGHYYEAITILAKYCAKNSDFDNDDDDNGNGNNDEIIQIKLEKILVNRGDMIAEYVPSEIDLTNDTQYKINRNISTEMKTSDGLLENNIKCSNHSSLDSGETSSNSIDQSLNLNNNVTYRRGQGCTIKKAAISPILTPDDFNFDIKGRNIADEKFIGQIINRLSNSSITNDKNENKKKCCRLIPSPKYLKKKCIPKEPINPTLLDTSIVSKSPNFKIPIKKTIDKINLTYRNKNESLNCINKQSTLKNIHLSPTSIQSSFFITSQLKNASSTPEKKIHHDKYKLKNLPLNKKFNNTDDKTSMHQTYIDNNNVNQSSLDDIKANLNIINRKKTYKNIVKKLDNSMYDDDCEINLDTMNNDNGEWKESNNEVKKSPSVRSKLSKLFNNVDRKTILGITKYKSTVQDNDCHKLKNNEYNKCRKVNINNPVKCENIEAILESPGSSHPLSANYPYESVKNQSNLNDEQEMWNELCEIYNNKGDTPPASVSKFTNDSFTSVNTTNTSSTIDDVTFDLQNKNNISAIDIVNKQNSHHYDSNNGLNDSSNTEFYNTPIRSTISSRFGHDSFVSLDEEYAYVDTENDIAFMERRLRVLPIEDDMNRVMYESTWLNRNDELASGVSQISSVSSKEYHKICTRGEFAFSNASLRHQLIAFGDTPGPITNTTYHVYLKRLYKLKHKNSINLNQCIITSQLQNEIIKSPVISKGLLSTDWIDNLKYYRELEELAFHDYEKPNANRKYRGGISMTSFNYLLMDPRVTNDLPRNGRDLPLAERWKIFLKAIFYVGKGKNARPFAHLYESHEIWTGKKSNDESNDKIQRILNIWREGKGVICHQVFINSMQEEALTREAAMIDAIGTNHLCNCNRGNYYGLAVTMSKNEKIALGKYLLYKSMEILMHNGERQQFPKNIE